MSLTKVTYSMIDGASVNVMDFGATGDGVTDDFNAFKAAIDYLRLALNPASSNHPNFYKQAPARLFIPAGKYMLSKPLVFDFSVEGETNGYYGSSATQLQWTIACSGLVFLFADSTHYPVYDWSSNTITSLSATPGTAGQIYNNSPATGSSSGSMVVNMTMYGYGATGTANYTFSGIETRANITVKNTFIYQFKGNGIRVRASNTYGDPNIWGGFIGNTIESTQCDNNDGHGFFIADGDSSANTIVNCQFTHNKAWGIYDESGLGNTYIGGQCSYNTLGSCGSFYDTARTLFINVYSEDGVKHIGRDALAIGGINNGGFAPYTAGAIPSFIIAATGNIQQTPTLFRRYGETPNETSVAVALYPGEVFRIVDNNFLSADANAGLRFKTSLGSFGSCLVMQFVNETYSLWYAPTPSSTGVLAKYGTSATIPGQFTVDSIALPYRRMTQDSAAPVAGEWAQGDIVYNTAPTSGGYVGWVCTAGGTPGTWKTFGQIS